MKTFKDRTDAGRQLAAELAKYREDPTVVVLGLPRGGVVPAYEVARALDAPLDVCLVRKLGVPGRWELAMGAVASGEVSVLNSGVIKQLGITQHQINEVATVEREELHRRETLYREGRPAVNLAGRRTLLIDDGLATGATMRAAVQAARARDAASVIVAVAVAAPDSLAQVAQTADEVVCLLKPSLFEAVGQWYENFDQVTDEEVVRMLAERQTAEAGSGRAEEGRG